MCIHVCVGKACVMWASPKPPFYSTTKKQLWFCRCFIEMEMYVRFQQLSCICRWKDKEGKLSCGFCLWTVSLWTISVVVWKLVPSTPSATVYWLLENKNRDITYISPIFTKEHPEEQTCLLIIPWIGPHALTGSWCCKTSWNYHISSILGDHEQSQRLLVLPNHVPPGLLPLVIFPACFLFFEIT